MVVSCPWNNEECCHVAAHGQALLPTPLLRGRKISLSSKALRSLSLSLGFLVEAGQLQGLQVCGVTPDKREASALSAMTRNLRQTLTVVFKT